mgnify:CR=1 FL=1
MFPRSVIMCVAIFGLVFGAGKVHAAIWFVEAATGDYRIATVCDVWLD